MRSVTQLSPALACLLFAAPANAQSHADLTRQVFVAESAFAHTMAARNHEPVAIAAITAAELLHGCHRATNAGTRARRLAFVEGLFEAMPVLPFGLPEARRHAELWADLARQGEWIGPYDMLLGATALAQGYALATLNQREFARIPGLRITPVAAG